MAGCSKDDESVNGGEKENGEIGYVAVSIVQPKSTGTRTDNKFEQGDKLENEAKEGLFFIFSEDGNTRYGQPQFIALSGNNTSEIETPAVERIYNAVLVINGVKDDPTADAKQIVCVLNAPGEKSEWESVQSLSDLKGKISNYDSHTEGTFIMTNSVYKDGDNEILGAVINNDNIAKSATAALANPVKIYVERVVAKVTAEAANNFNNEGAKPAINGKEKELTINVTGIEIANIAQKSYLFKNINDITYSWAWDVNNKRSYWETVPSVDVVDETKKLTFGNKSYKDIVNSNSNFNIINVDLTEYIQPNTNSKQKTSILVTAQLMDGKNSADLAYICGGYTTKDDAKNLVAQYLAQEKDWYKKKTGTQNEYIQLEADDLVWKDNHDEGVSVSGLKSYEVVAQIDQSKVTTIYNRNGTEVTNGVTEANALLQSEEAKAYRARVFTDGKCYYFVNIDQSPVAGTEVAAHTYDGVVRNHVYHLTLNSIGGVGVPIFDPNDVIIPEKPEDNEFFYLAADIEVLQWRIVNQTIDFEF